MNESQFPQTVPADYGGKWIAWSNDGLRIVGVGESPEEALASAQRAGVNEIIYEFVPPSDELFLGGIG